MHKRASWVVLSVFLALSMWLYVQRILIPHQRIQGAIAQIPRGNLSDLYPRWLGARELLLNHRDPYSADVTRETQFGYYGRALDPKRPFDPTDQQGFAYPVYVVLLLAPTVMLPFPVVREIFVWLLAGLTAVSVLLWLRTLRWRLSIPAIVIWTLLTLGCFPAIQALKLQQLTLLVAFLLAGSMYAVVCRHFVFAGILLALTTIKPQLVFLVIAWLCIWVAGSWRERQRLLWSFAISMAVLVGAGELLLPGWISEFWAAIKDYRRYTGGNSSLLDLLLSPVFGLIASAVLVAIILFVIWRNRRAEHGTVAFQWSLCLTLATTLLVIPRFAPYNQVLLLPGLMMAVRARQRLWDRGSFSRFFCLITAVSVFWPFLAATFLVLALLFLPAGTVQQAWGLPFYPSFAIPITVYSLLLVSKEGLANSRETDTL